MFCLFALSEFQLYLFTSNISLVLYLNFFNDFLFFAWSAEKGTLKSKLFKNLLVLKSLLNF